MKTPDISCFDCLMKDCTILRNCTSEFLEYVNAKKFCMQYLPDQSIIFEGSSIDGVLVIYNGIVKIHVRGHRGKPFIVRLAKSGEILGHTADEYLKQPASVTAVEPTTVCFIEKSDFEKGLNNCPEIRAELMSVYKNEIKQFGYRTIHLVQMSVREKIAGALLHIAVAYKLKEGGSLKQVSLSREDISNMTGTTKEQVSKVMSEFHNENIIKTHRKHLSILQFAKLKAIAGLQ